MNIDRSKIIERIQLLLNLSRSPNPNEAESAVLKAKKLMDNYHISQKEVNDATSSMCGFVIANCRYLDEYRSVVRLLNTYFNVSCMMTGGGHMRTITIYGESMDVEIARQVFTTLIVAFKQRWKEKRRRCPSRYSFMCGLENGVSEQIEEQRTARPVSEQNALIVVKKNVEKAIADFLQHQNFIVRKPIPTKKTKIEGTSYWVGVVEGRTINIYTPCKGEVTP
jgi:hypothetical protein